MTYPEPYNPEGFEPEDDDGWWINRSAVCKPRRDEAAKQSRHRPGDPARRAPRSAVPAKSSSRKIGFRQPS